MFVKRNLFVCSLVFLLTIPALAQVDARMFQQPDVSATHITYVYAGDIWIVSKEGGLAHRLSSPRGEESFPRFSPDGSLIAFSGNYDGNTDVYIIPALGGSPKRITYHPMPDRLIDWRPIDKGILFASSRESGRQRFNQFYTVSAKGGLPEKLPIPYGEFGAFSPDGKILAYMPISRDFRTWKRYRGGLASEIWLFDLSQKTAKNITSNPANDAHPMWHGRTLYFLSDRGPKQRQNIWKYNLDAETYEQVTHFEDFDITFPSIGPSDIVFEAGGRLFLLDLGTEKHRKVVINVVTDLSTLKPQLTNVGSFIQNAGISPSGKRAVFESRGEIFSVPAEHGVIRNLSQSTGSAERYPAWSPDGKHIAFWSDKSGEYELMLKEAEDLGKIKKLTTLGKGFRFNIYWSSDSKKIAFVDNTQSIQIYDIEKKKTTKFDTCNWMLFPALSSFELSWSKDSNWLAYSKTLENYHDAIFLYNVAENKKYQVTSGYYNDFNPVFDPDGKYLYFFTSRSFMPVYSALDATWIYPNVMRVAAVALRKEVPSPLAPRNDAESTSKEELKKDEPKKPESKKEPGKKEAEKKEEEPLKVDIDDFERRLVLLPPSPGNYTDLNALSEQVIFRRLPRSGSGERKSPVVSYNIKERKEEVLLEDADGFQIAANGKKMLVVNNRSFFIVDVRPKQKLTKKLRTSELATVTDPRAEWKQMFNDIWRRYRDFFYDPGMHGLDWEDLGRKYGALLDDAVTRWDANFVFGELIAELNASHTYVGGGDIEQAKRQNVGLLGIDWALGDRAYRIARIVDGASWDSEVRSPFKKPGVDVKAGDYILAVNGISLDVTKDPWAAFQGFAGKTVALTVNNKPTMEGSREVLVETLRSETRLRHLEWIEQNRSRVAEASDGHIGYIYMPNTGTSGQTELIRQFYSQIDKDGFIIDERFNSGGQLADRFIELLKRPRVHYIAWRYGKEIQQPQMANPGPKVMLINGWSGSGGDALPFTFREEGVGIIIGTRTWGGLIGPAVGHITIDGGFFTVPEGRIFSKRGEWFAEGHGVDPDIEVIDDPSQLAKGVDPQLERAIEEVLRMIKEHPRAKVGRPAYEDRTAKRGN